MNTLRELGKFLLVGILLPSAYASLSLSLSLLHTHTHLFSFSFFYLSVSLFFAPRIGVPSIHLHILTIKIPERSYHFHISYTYFSFLSTHFASPSKSRGTSRLDVACMCVSAYTHSLTHMLVCNDTDMPQCLDVVVVVGTCSTKL